MRNSIMSFFEVIEDKRDAWKVKHNLLEIIFIAIVATVCGMDTWQDIADFAEERETWFRKYMRLDNGIPSHDTMERCFKFIEPKQFQKCFISWTDSLRNVNTGETIAIDGKTMRGTSDQSLGKSAIHIVSAWASENKIVLGQVKTNEKSNEITAIPELLDLLVIKGSIITIDAMGTQKDIASKIKEKKADYVLALKENQKYLYNDVKDYFETALKDKTGDFKFEENKRSEIGHGRIETRTHYFSTDIQWLTMKEEWSGLKSIGMVVRKNIEGEKTTIDTRYFISSLNGDVEKFAKAVREHWGVESMHWNLDVTFSEDKMHSRKDYLPENLAVLKRIALNMLKKETIVNKSMRRKRNKALLNEKYLEKILFG